MAKKNTANRIIIRKAVEKYQAATAKPLTPETTNVTEVRQREAVYVADWTDESFYTGNGSKGQKAMARVTKNADRIKYSGPVDANGLPDIGDILFKEDELDTLMDINPHPNTGLLLRDPKQTSRDNSWRVY